MDTQFLMIKKGSDYLQGLGVNAQISDELMFLIAVVALLLISFIVDFCTKVFLNRIVKPLVKKTKAQWDDILLEKNVFKGLAHVPPVIVLKLLIPIVFVGFPRWIDYGMRFTNVYLVYAIVSIILAITRSLEVFMNKSKVFKDKPVESYMQLLRLITYIISGIYIISLLMDKSPVGIFSALGAMSVVLMLVFKDTILGFVASIQLAANDMVKLGDWVEFSKYGANGDVIEIKLQTIKIRNWDKTISTVPTYAFVSDAFINWRGMSESGGRRIKRSLMIDMHSIKFCDEEMLQRFKKIKHIQKYLDQKIEELNAHNQNDDADLSCLVNGRRLTNIGTFRAYVHAYLSNMEILHKDMTFLVRQLQSTDKGLPLEIYVFSKDQRWANYEAIQSDIFDHLLAIVEEFDLEVYQSPSGSEISKAIKTLAAK